MITRLLAAAMVGITLGIFLIAAPVLFAGVGGVLPDSSAAGELAGPMFLRVNLVTLAAALAALGLERSSPRRLAAIGFILGLTCIEMGLITPRIESLRTELKKEFGSVSTTPKSDPRRGQFGMLHGVSTVRGGIVVLLWVVLVTPMGSRPRGASLPSRPGPENPMAR